MNNTQRRQLSREEVKKVTEYWLINCTGYTNKRIADEIGTTDKTVEKKRQEMESVSEIPKLDKLEGRDGRKKASRDGINFPD
jgi:FixJ family two-component response regulator